MNSHSLRPLLAPQPRGSTVNPRGNTRFPHGSLLALFCLIGLGTFSLPSRAEDPWHGPDERGFHPYAVQQQAWPPLWDHHPAHMEGEPHGEDPRWAQLHQRHPDVLRWREERDERRLAWWRHVLWNRHLWEALEVMPSGRATVWDLPEEGTRIQVVPIQTWQEPSGRYCREYTTTVLIGGQRQDAYGQACRQPDGSWQEVP